MKKTQKILIPLVLVFFIAPSVSVPVKSARGFSIRDYQRHLNRKFKKQKRLSTRFIIVHTSEAGLESTLRTLSSGKKAGRSRTRGGHAHYAIARNGRTYRILHHRYRANHTGLSMWNGVTDISSHSIGIELVGYHYRVGSRQSVPGKREQKLSAPDAQRVCLNTHFTNLLVGLNTVEEMTIDIDEYKDGK